MMYFGPTPTTLPTPGGSAAGTSRALSTARFYSLNGKHEKSPFMQPRLSTATTPTPSTPPPPFCLKQVIQSMLPFSTHKSNMASPYYLLYMFLSPSLFSLNSYIFISPPCINKEIQLGPQLIDNVSTRASLYLYIYIYIYIYES